MIRMNIFFYGLFMDVKTLKSKGITASNPRKGYLMDYALKIGKRASLLPSKGEKSYGIVMSVNEQAILDLYTQASVADYIAEQVNIVTFSHDTIEAVCYNLPATQLTGTNAAYAKSLFELSKKQGFPDEYLEKIKKMGKLAI